MSTENTRRVARAYFDTWTTAAGPDQLRPLLDEGFVFEAGPQRIEGREAFLAGGGWPEHATTTMVADGYDGGHAFQLYDAVHNGHHVRIAEHLVVRDDRIVSSEIVVDAGVFSAFLAGAPLQGAS